MAKKSSSVCLNELLSMHMTGCTTHLFTDTASVTQSADRYRLLTGDTQKPISSAKLNRSLLFHMKQHTDATVTTCPPKLEKSGDTSTLQSQIHLPLWRRTTSQHQPHHWLSRSPGLHLTARLERHRRRRTCCVHEASERLW